mmetsp:Transcript_17552/g.35856  ORF Transcript_17552/g.35856 Transcript_17552/m.35856 type:complete len:292 (+) Transcript_17552:1581-2456(+)
MRPHLHGSHALIPRSQSEQKPPCDFGTTTGCDEFEGVAAMRRRMTQYVERPTEDGKGVRFVHLVWGVESAEGGIECYVRRAMVLVMHIGRRRGHVVVAMSLGGGGVADAEVELEELVETFVGALLAGGELFHHAEGGVGAELSSRCRCGVWIVVLVHSIIVVAIVKFVRVFVLDPARRISSSAKSFAQLGPNDDQSFQRVQKGRGILHGALLWLADHPESRIGITPRRRRLATSLFSAMTMMLKIAISPLDKSLEIVMIQQSSLRLPQIEFVQKRLYGDLTMRGLRERMAC